MDSYTVMLCTDPADDRRPELPPRLEAVLRELHSTPDPSIAAAGAAFVSVVRPGTGSGGGAPDWRRLKDDTDAEDLETAGRAADICAALDSLADRLPDRDVPVNVVWLCGARVPPPERGGLLASLLRWRLWHGAVMSLRTCGGDREGGGAAARLATWRRILDARDSALLRPTLRLRLRLPSGSPTVVISLQALCDAESWDRLTAAAATAHDSGQEVSLCLLDGAEVVSEVAADSVPPAALTDCRLRLRQPGAAADGQCSWGGGRTALLVRLLTAPTGDGDRRRDAEDWRRMAADGRPPDRRAPLPNARLLHFIITAPEDGSRDGVMTLLDPASILTAPRRPPRVSLTELQTLAADCGGWAAAADLISRLSGAADEPSCWPERRGLAYWQEVHRRAAPAPARPAALVLDADGILGALCDLSTPAAAETRAADTPATPQRLARVPWPEAAEQHGPGVYYNTSAAAEEREMRAAKLRERCVAAETACTCSVWRSDAVSVSKAPRSDTTSVSKTPALRSSPRRRPPTAASSQRSATKQQPATSVETTGSSRQTEFKHRLGRAIHAALSERGIGSKHAMFRSCARKLATIVRAYLQDVKGAGETSARQMLQLARVHVKHVIKVQRELQSAV